jgi:TolB-like protein/tetratricopeptide (TPR) repeat protein
MIGKTVSHYRIVEKLGEGGMGVVYRAEDTRLERTVALKFLPSGLTSDPDAKQRFIREARAASALDHPNICTIHEVDESDDGQLFIVMTCYAGRTLQEIIDEGPLPIDDAVDIAGQVARGLSKAHAHGIVHRDIKPGNVFVTEDGQVKIFDFGLAKLGAPSRLTRDGSSLGTLTHMSPELLSGGEADERSDIWALGVLLYEMVTGRLPFEGSHDPAVMYSVLNQDPPPIEDSRAGVPPALDRVVRRCLQKNPAERYPSVEAVAAELERIAGRDHARTPARAARGRAWSAAMGIAAVVVVVAAGYALYSGITTRTAKRPGVLEPAKTMIVVLPFQNLGQPDVEYFADGVTEEITNRLASLSGLGVISRTSAFQYKSARKSIKEIGKELDVDYVLEGTVRWDAAGEGQSKVRVTPQLIRVADDTHVWSDQYDRVLRDIFDIQTEIAARVSRELDVTLLEPERRALETHPTDNLEAYQAYLRGLDYASHPVFSLETSRLAIRMFERAVELDSSFALAYAALANAHSSIYNSRLERTADHVTASKTAVDRALELQPDLPEAQVALGYYYYHCLRDDERALEAFDTARRHLPNQNEVFAEIGWIRRRQGRWEDALDNLSRSLELSPRDPNLQVEVGNTNMYLRRYAEAESHYDQAIAIAPDQVWAYAFKAVNWWLRSGDLARARAELERMPPTSEPIVSYIWIFQEIFEREYEAALDRIGSLTVESIEAPDVSLPKPLLEGLVRHLRGEPERAVASFESARVFLERAASSRPNDGRVHSALGIVYAALGRREDAIREAARGVELLPVSKDAILGPKQVEQLAFTRLLLGDDDVAVERLGDLLSTPAMVSVSVLRIDPRWDELRENPRFAALLDSRL